MNEEVALPKWLLTLISVPLSVCPLCVVPVARRVSDCMCPKQESGSGQSERDSSILDPFPCLLSILVIASTGRVIDRIMRVRTCPEDEQRHYCIYKSPSRDFESLQVIEGFAFRTGIPRQSVINSVIVCICNCSELRLKVDRFSSPTRKESSFIYECV